MTCSGSIDATEHCAGEHGSNKEGEGGEARHPRENMEIIEFPWVILDTRTARVVHQEQHYLADVLRRLDDCVAGLGRSCVAVTHGTYDLGGQLEVCRWRLSHGRRPPRRRTLEGLCEDTGAELCGRLHCGLDDALTVAAVCCALLNDRPKGPPGPPSEDDRQHPMHDVLCDSPVDFAALWSSFASERGRLLLLKGVPSAATAPDVLRWLDR
eukprot:gene28903-8355_t